LNLGALASILLAEWLYVRAVGRLGDRGFRVGRWQQVAFHAGMTLWAVGLLSPVDSLGEEGLTMHMVQHLLIADIAAPLILVGIRSPVMLFVPPRALLVGLARRRRLRAAFRALRRPLVAVPVYVIVLYGWHFAFAFEAAVEYELVHVLQHSSFVGIGILVWWSALEPKRRRVPGELWKVPYLIGSRLAGMFLGMAFVITREPVYTSVYGSGERGLGLEAVQDQQIAGALMLITDGLIMFGALTFFFWRASKDDPEDVAAGSA
jgi:putative copper resistance protein D